MCVCVGGKGGGGGKNQYQTGFDAFFYITYK